MIPQYHEGQEVFVYIQFAWVPGVIVSMSNDITVMVNIKGSERLFFVRWFIPIRDALYHASLAMSK